MSERSHRPAEREPQQQETEKQPRIETHVHQESNEHKTAVESPDVEEIRSRVEQHAATVEKITAEEKKLEHPEERHHPLILNKHLKDTAYDRTMIRVQKRLSVPNRYLSKAVHSPLLDRPAELAGKTITRPSGILGGAFFALIGTSIMLWVAQTYGYQYNFLIAILTFALGFVVGLLVEAIWRLLRQK